MGEGGSGYSAEVLIAVEGSFNLLLHKRAGVVGKTLDPKVSSTMYIVLAAVLCHLGYNCRGFFTGNSTRHKRVTGPEPNSYTHFEDRLLFSMWFLPMNSFSLRFKEKDTLKSSMVQNVRG